MEKILEDLIASDKNEEDLTDEERDAIMLDMGESETKCKYCNISDECSNGVSGGPNGPIYPPCCNGDISYMINFQSYLDDKREGE